MDAGFPIVVLASSAGGVHALIRVVAPLPSGFPAAMVVVQHQSPQAPNVLPEILARRTVLPVSTATDGVALAAGRVLVAPPGVHLLAAPDGTLATIAAGSESVYRPSADLLLATLATVAGPQVIAVVLSGMGTDAATGVRAVQRFGGAVLVADPRTAEVASMPLATIASAAVAARIVPIDDLGPALIDLVDVARH